MSRWSPSLSLLALACARTEPGTADELPACHPVTIDAAVCDPAVATFTLASNNPWYPLEVGQITELEGVGTGDEEGIVKRVVRTVLPDLRTILGTETHILRHETYWDGVIHEVAMNFYVETTDGNVCYFGEDVEFYDTSGVFQNTQGTWKAGENDALPGVIMPANPQVGDAYYQEMSPGIALDQGRIAQEGLVTELDGASYPTLQIMDTNPIDDETPCAAEEKRYAAGIGEVMDVELTVVAFTPAL